MPNSTKQRELVPNAPFVWLLNAEFLFSEMPRCYNITMAKSREFPSGPPCVSSRPQPGVRKTAGGSLLTRGEYMSGRIRHLGILGDEVSKIIDQCGCLFCSWSDPFWSPFSTARRPKRGKPSQTLWYQISINTRVAKMGCIRVLESFIYVCPVDDIPRSTE